MAGHTPVSSHHSTAAQLDPGQSQRIAQSTPADILLEASRGVEWADQAEEFREVVETFTTLSPDRIDAALDTLVARGELDAVIDAVASSTVLNDTERADLHRAVARSADAETALAYVESFDRAYEISPGEITPAARAIARFAGAETKSEIVEAIGRRSSAGDYQVRQHEATLLAEILPTFGGSRLQRAVDALSDRQIAATLGSDVFGDRYAFEFNNPGTDLQTFERVLGAAESMPSVEARERLVRIATNVLDVHPDRGLSEVQAVADLVASGGDDMATLLSDGSAAIRDISTYSRIAQHAFAVDDRTPITTMMEALTEPGSPSFTVDGNSVRRQEYENRGFLAASVIHASEAEEVRRSELPTYGQDLASYLSDKARDVIVDYVPLPDDLVGFAYDSVAQIAINRAQRTFEVADPELVGLLTLESLAPRLADGDLSTESSTRGVLDTEMNKAYNELRANYR